MVFSLKITALYSPLFVSLIWGITLYFKNYKVKNPGYYMSLVQLSAVAIFVSLVPFYHQNVVLSAQMDSIFYGGLLSIFPFVYFYVRNIATKAKIKLRQQFFHLIPAFVFTIIGLFIPIYLSSEELKIYALNTPFDKELYGNISFFLVVEKLVKLLLIMQSGFYLFQISVLIKEYKNRVNDYFSNIKSHYYNWIHLFYTVFVVSLLAAIPALIAGNTYLVKNDNHLLTVTFFTLSIIFYLIAFIADNHKYITDKNFYFNNNIDSTVEQSTIEVQKKIASKIQDYFVQEKPYKNGDLKITDVAKNLATNRTYISDAIRNVFHLNFNEYVNSYRIDEAIILLIDNDNKHLTIAEICEEVGFNTYSSFTRCFKKMNGCTPNVYRKNQKNK